MISPKVSAILAVYNSEKTIEKAMISLLGQSDPVEIIVVDDGSTDSTKSLVVRTIRLYPASTIKMIERKHGGPALARNAGAKVATGKILLFVDADMVFDRHYVRKLVKPIIEDGVVGTYTVEERVGNWDNPLAKCWNYQEGWEDRKRFPKDPPLAGTDFRAILKKDFDRVGGFDNIGYTDTWSLFHKLGIRPLATHAICYHKNPGDLNSVYAQAKWAAKRPYKMGVFGLCAALLRTSLLPSLFIGTLKSVTKKESKFLQFKLVYDWGRFVGICEMIFTGKLAK
jgi:glycosyltransferase involved in cell wall biosynthesis